jgi:desulfoferrodoxin (superoxide reductase-like protein)
MRCLVALSTLIAVVSAFHGPCLVTRSHTKALTMMTDDASQDDTMISRRQVLCVAVKGSFLAAALAAGAPPALATDIAKQVSQLEKEFGDSANSNGAPEKHLPKVTVGKSDSNNIASVEVLVPHVMDAEKPHFIQAIWLKEESSGDVAVAKVFPATEASPPTLTCGAPKGAKLTPLLYCNLHGLWKGDTFTV